MSQANERLRAAERFLESLIAGEPEMTLVIERGLRVRAALRFDGRSLRRREGSSPLDRNVLRDLGRGQRQD
jgi:hypothetical protein